MATGPEGRSRTTRLVQALGLALASGVVALLLAEAALRVAGYSDRLAEGLSPWAPWLVYEPVIGRRNLPGYEGPGFRINARGFRGPEITGRKPDAGFRIACLGDSTTFGIWSEEPPIMQDRATS